MGSVTKEAERAVRVSGPAGRPIRSRPVPPARVLSLSVALLIPCLWLPRIHAGDLSSHLYNAWLALLVQEGRLEGLTVSWQWTNILFDQLLRTLLRLLDVQICERVAVGLAVLIFFWGAFAFVNALSHREPWVLAPCLAALAYGWTFHMGFFNYYLSLGLSLWALAAFCRWGLSSPWFWALLTVAFLGHPLPVAWAGGMASYFWFAQKMRPSRRLFLMAGALACMAGLRIGLQRTWDTAWSVSQLANLTGGDQLWVYDDKYFAISVAMVILWGFLFLRLTEQRGDLHTFLSLPSQMAVVTAAGILILPHSVLFPGHAIAFQFISDRLSLAQGVLVCALLATSRFTTVERLGIPVVVALFFTILYMDSARWDRIETQMAQLVRTLPPDQRVVSRLCQPDVRVDPLRHMVDRACLGWCFAYANYEPSSRQFSVRSVRPNPVVAYDRTIVWGIETGQHIVQPHELPLYQIEWAESGQGLRLRALAAGEKAGQDCQPLRRGLLRRKPDGDQR